MSVGSISIDFFVSLITTHLTDSVLQHNILLEQVVHRNFTLCVVMHRALQEEAQEALDAMTAGAGCEIAQEYQVKAQGSGED